MWHHGMGFSSGMGHWFSGFGLFGMIFYILIIFAVIALVAKLFQPGRTNPPENRDTRDSLEILKHRLAKGDITEEEFHRIKKNL